MLKHLAALLLISGLFLPLSSCVKYIGPNNEEVHYVGTNGIPIASRTNQLPPGVINIDELARKHKLPPGIQQSKNYKYFFTDFSSNEIVAWLCLLGFTWPVVLLILLKYIKQSKMVNIIELCSPLLTVGSGCALVFKSSFGDRLEIGYWTALLGILMYSLHSSKFYISYIDQMFTKMNPHLRRIIAFLIFFVGPIFPLWQLKMYFVH